MTGFNVLIYDVNRKNVMPYDVMPYLEDCYNRARCKPVNFEEFKKFINDEARYQFWARCQYELVVDGFPQFKEQKIDVYDQIKMNLEIITELLMKRVR